LDQNEEKNWKELYSNLSRFIHTPEEYVFRVARAIDAAERYTLMEEKEQQELLQRASMYTPLFPRARIG
jgi:hypothetical protein